MTTPPARLDGAADDPPPPVIEESPYDGRVSSARVVTRAQVDRAVLQLRERPGKTPAEQVQAVLRALDLTVAPDPVIPEQR
jgi:hypothetical protein